MHVKLVVNSFPKTSETFLFNLVTGLESEGVKVTVCALSQKSDKELYKCRLHEWSGNIEIIPLRSKFITKIFSILKAITLNPGTAKNCISQFGVKRGLSNLLRIFYLAKGKPDIVHFAYSGLGINFLDALKLANNTSSKIFISCRGTAEKVKPVIDPLRKIQLKELFQYVDRVHCVSSDMLESLTNYGLSKDKAFINYPSINVGNFIRDSPYNSEKKNKWELLSTGRLSFEKGYIFTLLALRKLKDKGFCFTYNILGSGMDNDKLSFIIHTLGLENDVFLRGKVSSNEVKKFLNSTDIFILSSLYEGVANSVLEAMSMKIPVITTKVGGMTEVVNHRVNGMVVECFSQTSLAEALEELFESTTLRQKLSVNSRITIEEKFNINNQITKFITEYKKASKQN